jgi:hypothetical protein
MIGVQLSIGEGRHALARAMFFGRLGEVRHAYRDGMENQLGALGMALNGDLLEQPLHRRGRHRTGGRRADFEDDL